MLQPNTALVAASEGMETATLVCICGCLRHFPDAQLDTQNGLRFAWSPYSLYPPSLLCIDIHVLPLEPQLPKPELCLTPLGVMKDVCDVKDAIKAQSQRFGKNAKAHQIDRDWK